MTDNPYAEVRHMKLQLTVTVAKPFALGLWLGAGMTVAPFFVLVVLLLVLAAFGVFGSVLSVLVNGLEAAAGTVSDLASGPLA